MKHTFISLVILTFAASGVTYAAGQGIHRTKTVNSSESLGSSAVLVGGNVSSWITCHDSLDWPPAVDNRFNDIFPNGSGVGFSYDAGLLYGGILHDGSNAALTVNGVWEDFSGLQMGQITTDSNGKVTGAQDPSSPEASRVWKVRPDYRTADLTGDAAAFYKVSTSAVTSAMIDSVRAQYERDWDNWPASEGAPFVDMNGDGKYEPDVDVPGIAGASETLWTVANDLNQSASLYNSPMMGMEAQVTEWAWPQASASSNDSLQNNVYYKQIKLIYKGTPNTPSTAYIDSLYITYFSYTDDGQWGQEYIGCDSTRSYGFVYHAVSTDTVYSNAGIDMIPSVGFDMVQGPAHFTGNSSDSAIIDLQWHRGYKYWYDPPMTSFWGKFVPSTFPEPATGAPSGADVMYNFMRGSLPYPGYPSSKPIWEGWPSGTVPHTSFMFPGDPLTSSGWVDDQYMGDRRPYMSTGPIKMNVGDTAEIVVATMGALGQSNMTSLSVLDLTDQYAQYTFDNSISNALTGIKNELPLIPHDFALNQNYPNPFNPTTVIRFVVPGSGFVSLKVYDVLGREVATLVDGRQSAGTHSVVFNGSKFASGVYFYRLTAPGVNIVRKMLLEK